MTQPRNRSRVAALAALTLACTGMTTVWGSTAALAANPGSNLALPSKGATITASGTEVNDGRWTVAMGADGDKTTRWSSNTADDAWIQAQLAQATVVDHVSIYWERACAPTFKIQVSQDGTQWTDATEVLRSVCPQEAAALETPQQITFKDDVKATAWQFVRMQGLDRTPIGGQKYGMSLYEFEVWDGPEAVEPPPVASERPALVPLPANLQWGTEGEFFTVTGQTDVVATGAAATTAQQLADELKLATGYDISVVGAADGNDDITLTLSDTADTGTLTGEQAYRLEVTPTGVQISARHNAGLFYGTRTFKQLLPAAINSRFPVQATWQAPTATIVDGPRYEYRAIMLDVARSFLTVDEVKAAIDALADQKMSYLHLHLADDQGWRIEITNEGKDADDPIDYSLLTKVSGKTAMTMHGYQNELGHTGFYTQAEYRDLVAYAAAKHITIVPEIDMPGHTNAVLHAIPQLNTPGSSHDGGGVRTAPPNGTGNVGYSYLDPNDALTKKFIRHVFTQLAEMTPGPYLHMGGDEPHAMAQRYGHSGYARNVREIIDIVHSTGKRTVGWNEYAESRLDAGDMIQYWYGPKNYVQRSTANEGTRVIISDGNKSYLDMKYHDNTPIGLVWAGKGDFDHYYNWNPERIIPGVDDSKIAGNEAPMWSETIRGGEQMEFMAFPRAISHAEIGWTPQNLRNLGDFKARMARHLPRLTFAGINYYDGARTAWDTALAGAYDLARPGAERDLQVAFLAAPGTVIDGNGVRVATAADPSGVSLSKLNGTVTYTVDFGDGTAAAPVSISADQPRTPVDGAGLYTLSARHAYAQAGTYTVTVTGSDGSRATGTVFVNADANVPEGSQWDPSVPPEVALEVEEASVNQRVEAEGLGFQPGVPVQVQIGEQVVGSVRPDVHGGFTVQLPIAPDLYDGVHQVTFTQTLGEGNVRTASTRLRVNSGVFPLENPVDLTTLPRTAVTADSQEEVGGNGEGFAYHATDGNTRTFWHTQWQGGRPAMPHWLRVDLGKEMEISGVGLLPRQGTSNGRFKDFSVEVSTDGVKWTKVYQGQHPNIESEHIVQCRSAQQDCDFQVMRGRYLRLHVTSNWQGDQFATLAELRVGARTGNAEPPTDTPAPTPTPTETPAPEPQRIAGANRVETAIAAYRAGKFEGDTVVLVSGKTYPDALAAAPLAAALDAPVLVTMSPQLEGGILQVLQEKKVARVVIVGGEGSVAAAAAQRLQDNGFEVERVAGKNRFETAVQATKKVGEHSDGVRKIFVVDGTNFADALAVGAVADAHDGAILLSNGKKLPSESLTYLAGAKVEVVAVGGNAASAVKARSDVGKVQTVVGRNRYQTATLFAAQFAPQAKYAAVVSGEQFADALGAGALAADNGGVLLLTPAGTLHADTAKYLRESQVTRADVVGGAGTLSELVRKAVGLALQR
ncbi:family 20 glycosylhydrolase [Buchananella hordeovulneris]|uniref:family 20 glycosylhydrolase n=1 Tax=Buchananella hordeovulneris TaxID=52770 RepID=UPI0026DB7887|nr:family 20 glycosylhydrolase [Buchananella hordeovulneris]MDO5081391.1 family 20 glycosylhydrolase [Buchananella hordeovulneris]